MTKKLTDEDTGENLEAFVSLFLGDSTYVVQVENGICVSLDEKIKGTWRKCYDRRNNIGYLTKPVPIKCHPNTEKRSSRVQ